MPYLHSDKPTIILTILGNTNVIEIVGHKSLTERQAKYNFVSLQKLLISFIFYIFRNKIVIFEAVLRKEGYAYNQL